MIRRYDDPARAPGALSARLATDCYAVRSLAGERAATSAQLAVTLVAGLGVSFAANWRLTLVVLALVPIIGGVLGAQGAVIARAADAARDATRDAGAHAAEALRHVRTCASLGLEARAAAELSLADSPESEESPPSSGTRSGCGSARRSSPTTWPRATRAAGRAPTTRAPSSCRPRSGASRAAT